MYPDSNIAPTAEKLLARVDEGNPPKMGFASWLPDLSMPDWTLWGSDDEEEDTESLADSDSGGSDSGGGGGGGSAAR